MQLSGSVTVLSDSSDTLFDNICTVIFFFFLQNTFNSPLVYITENGFAQVGALQMEDVQRSGFYRDTIQEVEKGIFVESLWMSADWMYVHSSRD